MPRMQVLSAEEQVQFSTPPVFNSVDRKRYLYSSIDLTERAQDFRSPTNQIYFLLSCGYFKYCKKFFHPRDYQEKDVVYISKILGYNFSDFNPQEINEATRRRQRNIILKHFGYIQCDDGFNAFLREEIKRRVCIYLKPKIIFQQCLELCHNNHVLAPGYDSLSKAILKEINTHKRKCNIFSVFCVMQPH